MVRKLPRVPETDRPQFARNLGRMIEAAGSSDVHSRIAELLEDTFGCEGAASALKKRRRYVRLSTEPLPQPTRLVSIMRTGPRSSGSRKLSTCRGVRRFELEG